MVVTFIGHRKLPEGHDLRPTVKKVVLELVDEKNADTFLFGSRSAFDALCLETVTEIKEIRPHIKRVYVRAGYPYIDRRYLSYLLSSYDDTCLPPNIENAGKAAYVERNEYMIDRSDICVFYYDENYLPPLPPSDKRLFARRAHSGTELAYRYARSKGKTILNLYRQR